MKTQLIENIKLIILLIKAFRQDIGALLFIFGWILFFTMRIFTYDLFLGTWYWLLLFIFFACLMFADSGNLKNIEYTR